MKRALGCHWVRVEGEISTARLQSCGVEGSWNAVTVAGLARNLGAVHGCGETAYATSTITPLNVETLLTAMPANRKQRAIHGLEARIRVVGDLQPHVPHVRLREI